MIDKLKIQVFRANLRIVFLIFVIPSTKTRKKIIFSSTQGRMSTLHTLLCITTSQINFRLTFVNLIKKCWLGSELILIDHLIFRNNWEVIMKTAV